MVTKKEVSASAVDGDQHAMEHEQSRDEPGDTNRLHQQRIEALYW